MNTSNNRQLRKIGEKIAEADKNLVRLLAKRLRLSEDVAKVKLSNGIPFLRLKIESQRLKHVSIWAKEQGVSPEFARALLHIIIGESCKRQFAISDQVRLKSLRKNC